MTKLDYQRREAFKVSLAVVVVFEEMGRVSVKLQWKLEFCDTALECLCCCAET